MKKFLVIGNPIQHSLSPKLHNHWLKRNKIDAIYEKKLVDDHNIKEIITGIKENKIQGINITVPFKKKIIEFVDELSDEAKETQSVNTIYKNDNKLIGHNTDISGFELSLRHIKYNVNERKVFILGSGGVVSSIVLALKKMKPSQIILSNRTQSKAEKIKAMFKGLEIVKWGEVPDFDLIINATSLGLNEADDLDLDYEKIGKNKHFYDVIYNPKETNFLKKGKLYGHSTTNGKMMFIYQAHQSFTIWHKIMPKIDHDTIKLIEND
jgi:shikimate dehydrogenase